MSSEPMFTIGGIDTRAIKELRETLLSVLVAPVGDNVKVVALETLAKVGRSDGTYSITGCHFQTYDTDTYELKRKRNVK